MSASNADILTAAAQQEWLSALRQGVAALGLAFDTTVQAKLLDYACLLLKWNNVYNLTAVRTPEGILTRHILDSLTIIPWLTGKRILDVGTGAGLPGIPLALALPACHVVLLDSVGKKIRFVTQAIAALQLKNAEAVQARVESYTAPCFDTIISRAFSTVQDMMQQTEHLGCSNGRWLAMKGRYPTAELATLAWPYQVHQVIVPGLAEQRHVVCMTRPTHG